MKQKACILFHEDNSRLLKDDAWGNISMKLLRHLDAAPPYINGDTHLAKFYRSNKDRESGVITNTMPGSTFTNYKFERHTFGSGKDTVDVIVGWYW